MRDTLTSGRGIASLAAIALALYVLWKPVAGLVFTAIVATALVVVFLWGLRGRTS